MWQRTPLPLLALLTAGCLSPAGLTRSAHRIGGRVTPAARAFARSTRRVVRCAGQAANDAALTARVEAALAMHKGLDQCSLQVSSEDNVIRLTGVAPSREKRALAAQVARQTVGVAAVVNGLRVAGRP